MTNDTCLSALMRNVRVVSYALLNRWVLRWKEGKFKKKKIFYIYKIKILKKQKILCVSIARHSEIYDRLRTITTEGSYWRRRRNN